MSGKFKSKFKVSSIVLAGMALSLGACADIGDREPATPNSKPEPRLSQSVPPDRTKIGAGVERSKYKSVPIAEISSRSLKGTDPKAIALEAFGNIESEGGAQTVDVNYPQPDLAVVNITQTGVADDSIGGIRYRVEFVPLSQSSQNVKQWQMVWVGREWKCRTGRGHQDWSAQNCR